LFFAALSLPFFLTVRQPATLYIGMAFPDDNRSLGGAHRTMSEYMHHTQRVHDAKPTRAILEANKTTWQTTAQTLSINKAARKATSSDYMEHVSNIYHLNRRIENSYSATERKKNPYDATLFPAYQKRNTNLYRSSLHNSMMAWIPG
jgi:hypothetical protein